MSSNRLSPGHNVMHHLCSLRAERGSLLCSNLSPHRCWRQAAPRLFSALPRGHFNTSECGGVSLHEARRVPQHIV